MFFVLLEAPADPLLLETSERGWGSVLKGTPRSWGWSVRSRVAPSSLGLSGPQSPAFLHSLPPSPNQEPEINTKKIWLKIVAFKGVFRDLLQVRLGDGFADCCVWRGWRSGLEQRRPFRPGG